MNIARYSVVLLLCLALVGCSEQTSVFSKGAYGMTNYQNEEVISNITTSPVAIHKGEKFTKAGIIDLFLIEGNPKYTAGKKTVICSIYQFVEVDKSFRFSVEGPDCCVTPVDDHNFDLRPVNSLFVYRLSFNPQTGAPSIRMLSGSAAFLTIRYAVTQFW